ncbi:RNA polymerase sigma factor [Chitinophaga sancti]|uniref:RNA polymerase sigma-70 factor, ECF subfamily n=1 Tax=Chitinophaga sancti TaxID=1004 RepID=A0A1K1MJG8_9BACT|nr:sigma-70 family RNA polymerase sigma factor [Chitinophaga sancti]WQD62742.1 sigma-70 family RNA polymerase sigma factor [Chitinophaga sancti]WQG91634.1 sigma-70 family RNA polymerase sigma factor [Chitinophaga sancti]SFW23288.1 RNA polymerase sigma-70 factor, ECF subfamily [Chitinophaga sancti]
MNIKNSQELTDEELLQRYKSDDNSHWVGILFDRYALLLLGMCMKYLKNEEDARDSVQQIFLKVLADINKHQVQFFRAWIYMVTKNHCLMQLRQRNQLRQEEVSEKHLNDPAPPEEKTTLAEKEVLLNNMEQALELLNEEQRSCVKLFYLEKCSYQEITDQTGYTMLQVKSYIQNGKRNLKLLLSKQGKQ